MPPRYCRISLLQVPFMVVTALALHSEEPQKPSPQAPSSSLQQQLDELKEGQKRLLKEVEEIKKLLQEKQGRTNVSSKPAAPNVTSVNVYGEPFRGTNTARIAIVEYSDFNCGFCAKYAREVYPRIDEDYIKAGKVRYFFRDLPEPNETNSWLKARAARCAGDQGKFWEMHDLLFASQTQADPDFAALSQALGLDAEPFNRCLSTGKYLQNIQSSVDGARRMGLFGTPAFLIGTLSEDAGFLRVKKVLVGVETYDKIKSVLDELLAQPADGH